MATSDATFKYSFEITRDEYEAWMRRATLQSPNYTDVLASLARRRQRSAWLALALTLGFLIMLALHTRGWLPQALVVGTGLVVAGSWAGVTTDAERRYRKAVDRSLEASLNSVAAWYHTGPRTIVIDSSGIDFRGPLQEIRQPWPAISAVIETEDALAICQAAEGSYVIPKRTFVSPEECARLRLFVERQIARQGFTVVSHVRAYLADRDLACPRCRYNLRGCAGTACPECGLVLTLAEIPAMRDAPPAGGWAREQGPL